MGELIKRKINYVAGAATKTEKKLIERLNDVDDAELIYMSISELSERIGIAEATILRFCRKLGLTGYQEFKLILAQDMKSESSERETHAGKTCNDMISALTTTKNMIVENDIEAAADAILAAKHVHFFGVGNSGTAALEARNKLMRTGLVINACTDTHFQSVFSATMNSDHAVVLLSVSGSTKDMIDCAKLCKDNNAKIIVITNHLKSPLSKYGDIKLYTVQKETPLEGGSLVAKVSQLFVIEVLCDSIFHKLGDTRMENLEKSAESLVSKLL